MVLIDIARINKERDKTTVTALFVADFTHEDGASILHNGDVIFWQDFSVVVVESTPKAMYKAMKVRGVISVLYPRERR